MIVAEDVGETVVAEEWQDMVSTKDKSKALISTGSVAKLVGWDSDRAIVSFRGTDYFVEPNKWRRGERVAETEVNSEVVSSQDTWGEIDGSTRVMYVPRGMVGKVRRNVDRMIVTTCGLDIVARPQDWVAYEKPLETIEIRKYADRIKMKTDDMVTSTTIGWSKDNIGYIANEIGRRVYRMLTR